MPVFCTEPFRRNFQWLINGADKVLGKIKQGFGACFSPVYKILEKLKLVAIFSMLKNVKDKFAVQDLMRGPSKVVETVRRSALLIFSLIFTFFIGIITSGFGCRLMAGVGFTMQMRYINTYTTDNHLQLLNSSSKNRAKLVQNM